MLRSVLVVGNFLFEAGKPPSMCYAFAERLASSGLQVITTSSRPGRCRRLLDMIATAWYRRRDYDVACVDVFSYAAFIWAEAVCRVFRQARKPYVLILRGGSLPEFAARHPRRVRRLLRSAAAVTAPSRFLAERLRSYRQDIAVLPNALDIGMYPFRLRSCPSPRLVWLRSFHRIYDPVMAVHVLAALSGRWPEARLTMVGPDKGDGSLDRVRRTAAELGVADRLRLPGLVAKQDVPVVLNTCDIFLNTTSVDNMPVSVLEAMACGLCVVSTNVGGIPYLVQHDRSGLLVAPNDPGGMQAAVGRILSEPGLGERLSKEGRKVAEQADWSFILPRWEALLATAARDRCQ